MMMFCVGTQFPPTYNVRKSLTKSKHSTIAIDNVLEKLQKSDSMAMGPQVRFWVDLEKSKHSKIERVSVSFSDLIYLTEQAVLFMGQNSNTISNPRRLSILSSLMNQPKAKSMLKRKAAILQS